MVCVIKYETDKGKKDKIILKKETREEIEETKTAQKDRKKGGNEKEMNRPREKIE